MAKSARASVTKKNNQALKRKVFGPAETARNDRLNAKLLELAQQPKPLRAEMDVEEDGKMHFPIYSHIENFNTKQRIPTGLESAAPEAKDNDRATKGVSPFLLSISIPASLSHSNEQNLPTPPSTPGPTLSTTTSPIFDHPAQKEFADELLFFHLLGASTDVVGFHENGELELSYAGLT